MKNRVVCFVCAVSVGLLVGPQTLLAVAGARQTGTASPADVAGLYRNAVEPDVLVVVYHEGGDLYEEGPRTPREQLVESSKDHFATVVDAVSFVFKRNADGDVESFTQGTGGDWPGSLSHEERFDRVNGDTARLNHFRPYMRTEAMIPVRDGVRLHVVILRPEGSETSGPPVPFLMTRTPYGVDGYTSDVVNAMKPELAQSGYIFVFGDIRGRYESEGKFVMNRPIVAHKTKNDVDETTDTRDTIDWLLKNVPNNNGRVGVLGISYPGFLAMMAGIDAHPAVKAISPQAPMTDVWMGDDFFHNGAFRETYGFDYVQELEAQKTDAVVQSKEDTYNFFLRNVDFAGAAKAAGMENLPTAKMFLEQPSYTKFWRDMAVEWHLTKVEVPTLEVGGWWDQEDMWGTQAEYAALKPHDSKHEVFMVLGPWNHGGWVSTTRHLGVLDFGAPVGDEYRRSIETPFFEKYLKDRPGFDLKDVASFRTGVNQWERYDAWPPKVGFHAVKLYMTADGGLGEVAPGAQGVGGKVAVNYSAIPFDPIPYRHRPIQATYGKGSKWRTWLAEDQRFVSGRKDLRNFETPVLDHDVTVTGDVMADLFASTTGSDADWVVKLIDVYPDDAPAPMGGYQLMIVDEIFRGRYRESFEKPEPITPGKVEEYKWSLHGVDHTFLKGHRIMVEVQSSWFPLYDRNPQTFVPNIMAAPASAYAGQTVSIYGSAKYPSHLDVSVADR
ncbi:CocE/NonD family hydrolase [Edaphobacter acidisoli]|uniref:CocE/NonD family hydrolase n=1 Tax=Edaphobacter acidisoli TaxID=2040573 RepID=UPI001E36EA30|nr:CocE/NonD family hydrolase [Edaphobacter acidisoli]